MRVMEISRTSAAANAGLLLVQLGFDVDRLDIDCLDARFSNGFTEAQEVFFHRGKKLLALEDIHLEKYDAVIEDVGFKQLSELGMAISDMQGKSESLVVVSLSDFGLTGPYADWLSSEITVQAVGGVMHVCGYDGEPPLKLPGNTAAMILGVHGATAVASAVFGVTCGIEAGVHIDISAQDTLMQHWTRHISQYAYTGTTTVRAPRDPEGIHYRHTARAKDGWIYMLALRAAWREVADFLGLSEYVAMAGESNEQPWQEMEIPFQEAIAAKDRYTWFDEAAQMGWTFAPIEDPFDIMENPQNKARGFFEEIQVDGKVIKTPGLPYRIEY